MTTTERIDQLKTQIREAGPGDVGARIVEVLESRNVNDIDVYTCLARSATAGKFDREDLISIVYRCPQVFDMGRAESIIKDHEKFGDEPFLLIHFAQNLPQTNTL